MVPGRIELLEEELNPADFKHEAKSKALYRLRVLWMMTSLGGSPGQWLYATMTLGSTWGIHVVDGMNDPGEAKLDCSASTLA